MFYAIVLPMSPSSCTLVLPLPCAHMTIRTLSYASTVGRLYALPTPAPHRVGARACVYVRA
ncbi:hypothetical protein B0H10DRAFT_1976542, partial [Mycena sp. CBHHK59/15]